MNTHSLTLRLTLPLCLLFACGDLPSSDEDFDHQSDIAAQPEQHERFDRAIVVDGEVVLHGQNGEQKTLSLAVDAFVTLGFHAQHTLLIGAEPRALLPDSEDQGGYDLYTVDTRTGKLIQLTSGQEVTRAVWNSQTGHVLAATRQMEIVDIDPAHPFDLEVVVDHAITPAVSPDGRRLAYGRLPDEWSPGALPESISLHVYDLDTADDRELTSGFDDIEPIWTPDSQKLLFLSGGRTGVHSLWSIGAKGSEPQQLTNLGLETVDDQFIPSPSFNTEVTWSDDGQTLLFGAHYTDEGEIYTLDFSADPTHPSLRDYGPGAAPQWQNGSITVLRTDDPEKVVLASIDAQTGQRVELMSAQGNLPLAPLAAADHHSHETPSPEELDAMLNGSPRSADSNVRFQFPMDNYYGVNYFYDNNASSGWRQDKNCGTHTYDGHRGTDFTAYYGNNLYAAASGSIYHRVDGCATTGSTGNWCGNGFGNHVRIDHGGGWKSIYGHMTYGTVTGWGYKTCGDYLGVSGSSGNSSGPHLHFEVIRYGYPYDDPYSGPCSGPESYWTSNWYCQ